MSDIIDEIREAYKEIVAALLTLLAIYELSGLQSLIDLSNSLYFGQISVEMFLLKFTILYIITPTISGIFIKRIRGG